MKKIMRMSVKKKIVLWVITAVVGFLIMWPVYWIIKSSFTQQVDLFKSPIEYLPVNLTLDNYRQLFQAAGLTEYLKGTAVIPLMTLWRSLGLSDSVAGLVILYFSILIPFSTVMYSGFIGQIPPSLEEAARIDGATMAGAFAWIIVPLLKPIMATLCIINFITCLNEFFIPLMFTTKNVKVMSLLMSSIPKVNQYQMPWGSISAAGCMMLLPVILFIVCFEKNIMGGLMMGSIKQ